MAKKKPTIRTVWVVKCSSPEINQKKLTSPPHRLCHKLVQPCSRTNSGNHNSLKLASIRCFTVQPKNRPGAEIRYRVEFSSRGKFPRNDLAIEWSWVRSPTGSFNFDVWYVYRPTLSSAASPRRTTSFLLSIQTFWVKTFPTLGNFLTRQNAIECEGCVHFMNNVSVKDAFISWTTC